MAKEEERALRERINTELAGDGQRLRFSCIVQTHDGPLMLPCRPYIVQRGIDLEALGHKDGLRPIRDSLMEGR